MTDCCATTCEVEKPEPRYRRVLWIALVVNAIMFGVEIAAGLAASSVSLLADAIDFFGDASNYGVSLFVLALAPVWRSRAAVLKGATMGLYGIFVLAKTGWEISAGTIPEPISMGAVAFLALTANVSVAVLLYTFRQGDANMRSVWLCSRNDAIGNVAVILAAVTVYGTGTGWPDFAVAAVMAMLGLSAARSVLVQARRELADLRRTLEPGEQLGSTRGT
jgi:Co/Zn/Cd efflux system component